MKTSVRMERVKPSAIRAVQKRIVSKPSVISFAAGLPDPDLFPMEDLKAATNAVIENEGKEAFAYGLTKGSAPLIEALVDRMNNKEGIKCSAENISVTTGSQQGLAIAAMMTVDEGDVVIAENPSYLGGINACRPYGPKFVGVDTDEDGMIAEDLDKILSETPNAKLIYVIPNFQNPTGKAWTLKGRKRFMEVVEKYDILVLEDNPYGEIRFKGEFVPSLKSMDTKGQVMYLGSFSKVLTPGLRIAWVCADKEVAQTVERLKESLDLQCNQFSQMQAVEYMRRFDFEAHINEIQAAYKEKCNLMLSSMEKEFPEGITWTNPEGGMFIWVELPENLNADELLDETLDNGVAYIPGEFFYANESEAKKNTIRLNFSVVTKDEITKGIKLMAEVFKKHM